MPRPKRTKVASTTTRVANRSQPPKSLTAQAKAPRHSDRTDSFSDDSDGLVVKATRARVRRPWEPKLQSDVDFRMTGGLPVERQEKDDDMQASNRRATSPKVIVSSAGKHTPASKASKKSRVDSLSVLKPSGGQLRTQDRPTVQSLQDDDDDSLSLDNLLSFDSLDSDSPAHGTRPPSAMKVGGTPAHETSILALTNFKRRARQPSLLRMVHQTTDAEDNDLDILDDLDDFHPADESTPFNGRRSGVTEGANDETTGLSLSSTSSRGKKRKLFSPVVQVPRSSPPYDVAAGGDREETPRSSSSPSLPQEIVQSTEEVAPGGEQANLDIFSETMAPPKSSSDPVDEIEDSPEPIRRRRARKNRRATDDGISEEESSTHIKPNGRRKVRGQAISTAKLQALLPRRRTNVSHDRNEYDLQASDEALMAIDSDEDELQRSPPRQATRSSKATATKGKKKTAQKGKKATLAIETAKRIAKTYGRSSSDKENESTFVDDGPSEETSEMLERTTLPKSKLAAIAKKFEEVDAWEMDFEDVDTNGVSSSPWR